jgi:hypothetical protein
MKTSTAIFYMILYIPIVAAMYMIVFSNFWENKHLPDTLGLALFLFVSCFLYYQLDIVFILLPLLYYWYWDYRKRKVDFNYLLLAWAAIVPFMFLIKLHYYHPIDTYVFLFQLAIWLRILVAALITGLSLYKLAFSGFRAKI